MNTDLLLVHLVDLDIPCRRTKTGWTLGAVQRESLHEAFVAYLQYQAGFYRQEALELEKKAQEFLERAAQLEMTLHNYETKGTP